MVDSEKKPTVEISSTPEEDIFWTKISKSLISDTIETLDSRAQFMITTSGSLLTADFAILLITSNFTTLTVSPQFFFALSVLFFMLSLFPKHYQINPWLPDQTKVIYSKILDTKHRWHVFGFGSFFLGLLLIIFAAITFVG